MVEPKAEKQTLKIPEPTLESKTIQTPVENTQPEQKPVDIEKANESLLSHNELSLLKKNSRLEARASLLERENEILKSELKSMITQTVKPLTQQLNQSMASLRSKDHEEVSQLEASLQLAETERDIYKKRYLEMTQKNAKKMLDGISNSMAVDPDISQMVQSARLAEATRQIAELKKMNERILT